MVKLALGQNILHYKENFITRAIDLSFYKESTIENFFLFVPCKLLIIRGWERDGRAVLGILIQPGIENPHPTYQKLQSR